MSKTQCRVALVLSGGGARGAYEVGVLSHIRKNILKDRHGFDIHCGTSVGALNTCFLAARAHDTKAQEAGLRQIWQGLRSKDIYRGDALALSQILLRLSGYTASRLLGLVGIFRKAPPVLHAFRGVLDTSPFVPFLKNKIDWASIHKNIERKCFQAIAIGVTNIGRGQFELFIDKSPEVDYQGIYRTHVSPIQWNCAMASAAIPVVFPPVRIGNKYYMDGSVRQNTPMGPAVHLGANRILVIGVKHRASLDVSGSFPQTPHDGEPTFTHMIGKLLNALFLDHIEYDMEQMTRINRIIEWSEKVYGSDYLERLNEMLQDEGIQGDIASRGLRKIEAFSLFPSEPIGKIATEHLMDLSRKKKNMTQVERFFLKFLEIDPQADIDLLSYLMFDPDYIQDLIELGIRDAKRQEEELGRFLEAGSRKTET